MSYIVDIWTRGFPGDPEAWDLRDELLESHDEQEVALRPSPEMLELHRLLTARYPCICDEDNGPWSDGPLIDNFGPGLAILGISFSRVEEVLPFLVATATRMGFHVFDGQDETIHRPVGFVASGPSHQPVAEKKPKWWQF